MVQKNEVAVKLKMQEPIKELVGSITFLHMAGKLRQGPAV